MPRPPQPRDATTEASEKNGPDQLGATGTRSVCLPDDTEADAEAVSRRTTGDGSTGGDGSGNRSSHGHGSGIRRITNRLPGGRRTIAVAGALLLTSGGLAVYGLLNTDHKPRSRTVPTAAVTYEVQGKGVAEIVYRAGTKSSSATANSVRLPWKKTVRIPLGQNPVVSITLADKGGTATCSLAIRGRHIRSATAFGPFGRANCAGELPTGPESRSDPAPAENR